MTQRDRSEATRSELIQAARRLFAKEGFAGTSLEAIVAACGVTKGALYHHFDSKTEVFRAVFDEERRRCDAAVREAYQSKRDPWQGFVAGCRAYLEQFLDPGMQRISLIDGPAVLGRGPFPDEDNDGLSMIKMALTKAIEQGIVPTRPVEPLAHMLSGALCEGALLIARSTEPDKELRRVVRELNAFLRGLTDAR